MREENFDDWADIETGGAHSRSIKKVSAADKKKKAKEYFKDIAAGGDGFGNKFGSGYDDDNQSSKNYISAIKMHGKLITKKEGEEIVNNMKKILSHDDIVRIYNFLDDADKLTTIGKGLAEYLKA